MKNTFFNTLKTSLEEGIKYYEGKKKLKTYHIPDPAPEYTPTQIKRIRNRLHMSQHLFSLLLNVSNRTVQSWEQGARHPEKVACRLLQIVEKNPCDVLKI
ncbi:helix-turn-helix domain-containing protein [Chlamydiota bacterium]